MRQSVPSAKSWCTKMIKVAYGKGFCKLGMLNLAFEYLDEVRNSGPAQASGNWFSKVFLLRSGASSRFLCSPHHTPPPASQVCKFLLVQILCLSQTIISRQRLFRFYCRKECEERSTVKTKSYLLCRFSYLYNNW